MSVTISGDSTTVVRPGRFWTVHTAAIRQGADRRTSKKVGQLPAGIAVEVLEIKQDRRGRLRLRLAPPNPGWVSLCAQSGQQLLVDDASYTGAPCDAALRRDMAVWIEAHPESTSFSEWMAESEVARRIEDPSGWRCWESLFEQELIARDEALIDATRASFLETAQRHLIDHSARHGEAALNDIDSPDDATQVSISSPSSPNGGGEHSASSQPPVHSDLLDHSEQEPPPEPQPQPLPQPRLRQSTASSVVDGCGVGEDDQAGALALAAQAGRQHEALELAALECVLASSFHQSCQSTTAVIPIIAASSGVGCGLLIDPVLLGHILIISIDIQHMILYMCIPCCESDACISRCLDVVLVVTDVQCLSHTSAGTWHLSHRRPSW